MRTKQQLADDRKERNKKVLENMKNGKEPMTLFNEIEASIDFDSNDLRLRANLNKINEIVRALRANKQ